MLTTSTDFPASPAADQHSKANVVPFHVLSGPARSSVGPHEHSMPEEGRVADQIRRDDAGPGLLKPLDCSHVSDQTAAVTVRPTSHTSGKRESSSSSPPTSRKVKYT